ncbi:flagellar hook-associated protein FlgK [Arthrobacter pityocampae]|uniref:Flagellar hook-associated protein 1 n=1 Tax=Arthrobacter pityocampae TaxID=547334 RepID=A0A2S5IUC2_9MICC|nr:flagellar hook-associated protein FlgK [Arthrobacter pityocampae]PPB48149.1 flagellar hook-associated protein FlgK [Arthrobacter pityocampae]
MSTFSGLTTAYSGLAAARAGLDVTGQNIANATTQGYTRQRLETAATAPARPSLFTTGVRAGEGVLATGIARLGDAHLEARVRITAGAAGYTAVRAQAFATLEDGLREPGAHGVSASLQDFWAGWQEVSNAPEKGAPASTLLAAAGQLTSRIAAGYREVESQWATSRSTATGLVTEVNAAATQVADLNRQIRSAVAAGTSANELVDRRTTLTSTLAALTGATVRDNANGTADVLVAGSALVSGVTARALQVTGPAGLDGAGSVQVEWADLPGASAGVETGELAATLSLLARAEDGGPLAQAAAGYDAFATTLAEKVNTLHTGAGKGPFFAYDPDRAAASLDVLPTGRDQLAAGAPGASGFDGSVALAISEIGQGSGSPDAAWSAFVVDLGAAARTELQGNALAEVSATSALRQQLGATSVSMDEEQVNLLQYQHAYQGAARVMTAVDEMLDVLINRMGIVGR